jgi:hypothetical protein
VELFELFDDPFVLEQFARKRRMFSAQIGRSAWLPTPEDVVVQKLRWGRNKDLDDARDILAVQGTESLDMAYIENWCAQHGTTGCLHEAFKGNSPPSHLLTVTPSACRCLSPASQPQMTKPFAHCSLADLAHELQLATARDASGSALSADVVARITPCLLDHTRTELVLLRHPRVCAFGRSGLVCSDAAGSKQAWCSMLRDLFISAGVSVSDAAQLRVYLVVKQCAKLGRVRLPQPASPFAPIVPSLVYGRWCLQMFAAVEQLHGARVFLRVCNAQGAALVRIPLAPAAQRLRLRTLVPVYEMAMMHKQRLRGMGCGGRGKLALLMPQGGGQCRVITVR